MMRNPEAATALLALALVGVGALGCADEGPPRVAVLVPLSGQGATYGEPVQRGVLLALEELQRSHENGLYPYAIQIETVDTQSDPQRAARALADLFDRGATAAIGGVTDPEAAALAEVADRYGRVVISPTASRQDLPASRHFYRLSITADHEGNKMANFATVELGLQTAVVLAAEDRSAIEAADAFQSELERNHGKLLDRLSYHGRGQISGAALSPVVETAIDADPQAVYVADFSARAADVVEALDRQGFRGVVLTTSALTAPSLLETSKASADGALVTQSIFDLGSDNPRVEVFADAYRERWNRDPDLFAAHGYDAMQVLAQALLTEQARPSELWQGIRGLGEYRGVTGFLQFDDQGRAGKFPRVYVVDRGALDPVEGMPEWKKERLAQRRP